MRKNNNTLTVLSVRTVRTVRPDGHWSHDRRYPSGRCLPVRRTVWFNPKGR